MVIFITDFNCDLNQVIFCPKNRVIQCTAACILWIHFMQKIFNTSTAHILFLYLFI